MPREIINKQRLDDSKPAKTFLEWLTAKGKGRKKGGGNGCVLLQTAGRKKRQWKDEQDGTFSSWV